MGGDNMNNTETKFKTVEFNGKPYIVTRQKTHRDQPDYLVRTKGLSEVKNKNRRQEIINAAENIGFSNGGYVEPSEEEKKQEKQKKLDRLEYWKNSRAGRLSAMLDDHATGVIKPGWHKEYPWK